MKILEHRALPGPNHFSPFPTIYMLLDIEGFEQTPTDKLPEFRAALLEAVPTLAEHRCSEGKAGGFVARMEHGTWMGHVVEHLALEMQRLAGFDVGFGKTRSTQVPGVYSVVYRYRDEETGILAGELAVELCERIAEGMSPKLESMRRELRSTARANALGPSTLAIVAEARRRGIPVKRLNEGSYVQLGHGVHAQRIQATLTGRTSAIACEIADDKQRTKEILRAGGIAVPVGEVVDNLEDALDVARELDYPVVVKPLIGNHGRGITAGISGDQELREAYRLAERVHDRVLVEQHLHGHDFRVLVIDHKFVAAARRDPAHVVGDGRRTVAELVQASNDDPKRGEGHESVLTRIEIDDASLLLLERSGFTLESVPAEGQVVPLKSTANLSTGGTATDVTAEVHPAVRAMCERASRLVGLDIMGVDIVAPTLARPLHEVRGGIVEVNAAPGLRMHAEPTNGRPRNVGAPIVDMLFPRGSNGRIPIVAVTGTNGKTTTVRLISHILASTGAKVGLATTTGVELLGVQAMKGDYSGPDGARVVLGDPSVDHAVLEVARGGILRRGLGYDEADVGVFLNVASDHLGEGGIDSLEDLAEVKAVVVENVRRGGTAVLNADDPLVASYAGHLKADVTLFSMHDDSPLVDQHVRRRGKAVTVRGHEVVLRDAAGDERIGDVRDFPVTMQGHARFNVANVLAAIAACRGLGRSTEEIRAALESFQATPELLPGRLNLIDVGPFKVLVDYGHNVAALQALAPVVKGMRRQRVLAAANASGNRRDEDLRAFGAAMVGMYDHVALSDPDPRGRRAGETKRLLREGLEGAGMPPANITDAADEVEAVRTVLGMAKPDDLVVLQADDVPKVIELVRQHRDDLRSGGLRVSAR